MRRLPSPSGGNIITGHTLHYDHLPDLYNAMTDWLDHVPNDGLIYFRGPFNTPCIIPTTPETLKTVLVDNADDYSKPPKSTRLMRRGLGDGLFSVEGAEQKYQRKCGL